MHTWIWPTTSDSWETIKENNLWAIRVKSKWQEVTKGDKAIFYVNGTNNFQGAYEVTSDWHDPTIMWPGEKKIGEHVVAEINLKDIQPGFANTDKLWQSLTFVDRKEKKRKGGYLRGWHGPANNGHPIPEQDYNLILDELKRVQIEPDFKKIQTEPDDIIDLDELPVSNYEYEKIPQPDKKTLKDIYDDIEKGRCAVPDFQRYWTWKRQQVEELWESIFSKYYIGSLLTWKPPKEKLGYEGIKGGPHPDEQPELILDGQQRITAIYYAVKAHNKIRYGKNPYRFFLNINAVLNPRRPPTEIIDSYSTKDMEKKGLGNESIQYMKKIFPLEKLQNYDDWLFGFYKHLIAKEGYEDDVAEKYRRYLSSVLGVWSSYEIPVVKLSQDLDLDNVATVFERINNKGTPLNIFDLLNARFAIYKIVLKDEWEIIRKNHYHLGRMYKKNKKIPIYLIQTMSLIKAESLKQAKVLNLGEKYKNLDVFRKDEFLAELKQTADVMEETISWLTGHNKFQFGAIRYNLIPYIAMIPVFAALLNEAKKIHAIDTRIEKIRLWYWSSILGGRYTEGSATTSEHDFRAMKKWFESDGENPFKIANWGDFIQETQGAVYKAIMCLTAKKGAFDFRSGQPAVYETLEDHHIFPQSKKDIVARGYSIDSILNRTLIDRDTNRFISNKMPSEYITEIMKKDGITVDKMQKRFSTHLISKKAFNYLRNDDFARFIGERNTTISEEFERIMSTQNA